MKSKLVLTGLMMAAVSSAIAQSGSGSYEKIRYRDDDPFLFCEQGQIETPDTCWVPIYPYTGMYIETPVCRPMNNYNGRSWYRRDRDSLNQYTSVCPKGERPGSWDSQKSNGRQKDMVPTKH